MLDCWSNDCVFLCCLAWNVRNVPEDVRLQDDNATNQRLRKLRLKLPKHQTLSTKNYILCWAKLLFLHVWIFYLAWCVWNCGFVKHILLCIQSQCKFYLPDDPCGSARADKVPPHKYHLGSPVANLTHHPECLLQKGQKAKLTKKTTHTYTKLLSFICALHLHLLWEPGWVWLIFKRSQVCSRNFLMKIII